MSVPGIGPKAVELLGKAVEGDSAVETTYQLIGKFLQLKNKDMTVQAHMDAFWFYLAGRGINSHRFGIVDAIARKVDVMNPGIAEYDKAEGEEE